MLPAEGERRERPRIERTWSWFSYGSVEQKDIPTSLPLSKSQYGALSGRVKLIRTVQLFTV
jgi:hypothetical protein